MASPNKKQPSFFILPDEKRDYTSSIKLGNVIYNIKKPHMVLFDPAKALPAALTVADITGPKTLENYVIERGDGKTTKVGLFAKILEFFSFGADLSHESGTESSESYRTKTMTTELLDPTPAFLAGLKAQKAIMDILQDGRDPHAFIITGVATATGVVFTSEGVTDGTNEASLGVNVHGTPWGFLAKRSKKRRLKDDWEHPGSTLLAFAVQKIQLKDDELTATEHTDGAYFGDDDEPREYEVEFDAALDKRDVAGLLVEVGEDELVGGVFNLYLPDE